MDGVRGKQWADKCRRAFVACLPDNEGHRLKLVMPNLRNCPIRLAPLLSVCNCFVFSLQRKSLLNVSTPKHQLHNGANQGKTRR